MAQTFSTELTGIDSTPPVKPSATSAYGARVKRFRATITLAAQASGDTVVLADLPAGFVPAFFLINTSVTLGTATLALGTAASPALYNAATAYTVVGTPTFAGNTAMAALPATTATTRVLATIGAAALPGSGSLVIDLYASSPN